MCNLLVENFPQTKRNEKKRKEKQINVSGIKWNLYF